MSKNKKVVPEARQALNQLKLEIANEMGISSDSLKNNGVTSKLAGNMTKRLVETGEKQILHKK